MHTRRKILRPMILVPMACLAMGLCLAPTSGAAQETVYQTSELTQQPSVADANQARTAIMRSYSTRLQEAGVQGRVQVAFVVKADGNVDAESVQIIQSPSDALSAAAKVAVARIKFKPGQKDGSPVPCRVVMPISYGQAD